MMHNRTTWILALATAVVLTGMGSPSTAAKKVATSLDEVDKDFTFQGEYEGTIAGRYGCGQTLALQVIARGGGFFKAVAYPGGLPGSGWTGEEKSRYKGRRKKGVVRLKGKDGTIILREDRYSTVTDADGHRRGYLSKVYRYSGTVGAAPPWDATVLFDGTDTEHLQNGQITEEGLLKVGTRTQDTFRDYRLHLEFRLPYMPHAKGQGRSNSGIYLQSRYEVQILDSFGLEGKSNECGGLYKYREPDVNMCFPPLRWQTYDIWFTAPRFNKKGKKVRNARLTVWHNGVAIHDDVEVERKTGAGSQEGPKLLPIKFQNHGNPVRFRNIWIVEYRSREETSTGQMAHRRRLRSSR